MDWSNWSDWEIPSILAYHFSEVTAIVFLLHKCKFSVILIIFYGAACCASFPIILIVKLAEYGFTRKIRHPRTITTFQLFYETTEEKWAVALDFQKCGMCNQQRLRPACAYARDCWSAHTLVIWSCLQLTSKQWTIIQQFTARADLFLKYISALSVQ